MTNCIYYNEQNFIMIMQPFCMRRKKFSAIEHTGIYSEKKYKGIKCPCKYKVKNKISGGVLKPA